MKRLIPLLLAVFGMASLHAQPTFYAPHESTSGNGQICIPVKTLDFTDILVTEFTINWDNALLEFDSVRNYTLANMTFDETEVSNGLLGFSWGELAGDPATLTDETTLFEICYNVSSFCESTEISFSSDLIPVYVTRFNVGGVNIGAFLESGTITDTYCDDACVLFAASSEYGLTDELVCVDVSLTNFVDISSMQFSLNYDSTILIFEELDISAALEALGFTESLFDLPEDLGQEGQLSVYWPTPFEYPDNAPLFQVCFRVIGQLTEVSPIQFSNNPAPISVLGLNNQAINAQFFDGQVIVNNPQDNLQASLECIQQPDNCNDGFGQATVLITGGQYPYSYIWFGPNSFSSTEPSPQLTAEGYYYVAVTDNQSNTTTTDSIYISCLLNNLEDITIECTVPIPEHEFTTDCPEGIQSVSYSDDIIDDGGCESPVVFTVLRTYAVEDNCGNQAVVEQIIRIVDSTPPIIIDLPEDTVVIGNDIPDPSEFTAIDNCGEATMNPTFTLLDSEIAPCGIAATYLYEATDACGNVGQDTMIVYSSFTSQDLIDTVGVINSDTIICQGQSVQLFAEINNPLLNISWSPAATLSCTDCLSPVAFPQETTVYTILVSDGNGCMDSAQLILHVEEPAFVSQISTIDASCFGNSDGAVDFLLEGGGGAPYEIVSIPVPIIGDGGFSFNGMPAGSYTIDFSGANGCPNSFSFEILEPPALQIDALEIIPESCPGNNDGSITIVVSGGVGGYTYDWSGGSGGPECPNLPAGDYVVTVTDQNGCEVIESFTVGLGLVVSGTEPQEVCVNSDVQINIDAPNATGFQWSALDVALSCNDCPNPIVFDVAFDTSVEVIVSGPNNCEEVFNIPINVQSDLPPVDFQLGVTGPACEGATVMIMAPDIPFATYEWINPAGFYLLTNNSTLTLEDVTVNMAGIYTLILTDQYGCQITKTALVEIFAPPQVVATIINESCPDLCDGSITLDVANNPEYSFIWSTGENTPNITFLCPGIYSLTVADQDGCATILDNLVVGTSLIHNISNDTTICIGDSVSLFVDAPLATSFSWSPDQYLSCSDCPNPTVESPYEPIELQVTVSNENCSEDAAVLVDVRTYLDFHLLPFSNSPVCEGGTLELYSNIPNGQSYQWSGPLGFASEQSNPIVPNADAGLSGFYQLEAVDDIGCEVSVQTEVIITNELIATAAVTNASCDGLCDGVIDFAISGGTPPYTIDWMGNVFTDNILSDLCPGTYTFFILDNNECSTNLTVTVEAEDPIIPEFEVFAPTCNGELGFINIPSATGGGGGPYTVSLLGINIGQIPLSSINLLPGAYQFEIASASGCFEYFDVTIPDVQPILVEIQTTPSACEFPTGEATIFVTGGTPPYNYEWSNGATTGGPLIDLEPGIYSITITDDNNCSVEAQFEIEANLILGISEDTVICLGESAVLEVNAPYATALSWSPAISLDDPTSASVMASPTETTTYIVSATDGVNCTFTDSVMVTVAPENCTEVFTDSILIGQTYTWCSLLAATGGPIGFNFTSFGCNPGSDIISYDIDFNNLCIDYTGEALGADTLCVEICAQTGSPCYTAELQISVIENVVWPGDTDTTGIANNHDLLLLGLGIDSTGFVRPGASINWEAQQAPYWDQETPISNVNYQHIDTDGNGIIDLNDTLALSQNWGLEHNFRNPSPPDAFRPVDGVPFYIQPDTLIEGATFALPVILGSEETPAEQVYGVAFTIKFDPEIIKPGTRFNLLESWLGNTEGELLVMQKEFHDQGRLEIGISRLDGMNVDGSGEIGSFIISLEDDILFAVPNDSGFVDTRFEIIDVKIISFQEEELTVDTTPMDAEIISGIAHNLVNYQVQVYPNPTTGQLWLNSITLELEQMELRSVDGQLLLQKELSGSQEQLSLDAFPPGLYILKIRTNKGIAIKKITRFNEN